MYDLKFVNLGITIEHMVSSVNVFGFRIAFYGIIIGIAMILAMSNGANQYIHNVEEESLQAFLGTTYDGSIVAE